VEAMGQRQISVSYIPEYLVTPLRRQACIDMHMWTSVFVCVCDQVPL